MRSKPDSKRFNPTHIGQRFHDASLHEPARERAQRRSLRERVRFHGYGQSQIGGARRINQDQFFMAPLGSDSGGMNCFLGVADGIGGAPAGAEASVLAVE